ncbi:MAG TPA: PAS domain S-box protein [Vicinamibacterales bacterium]|nr:PAS domain S-box protein [Vicinamibacterales bacterium]
MSMPHVGHFDPARLAAAVALASDAVPAASDQHLGDALLARLCNLVEASHGLLIVGEAPDSVVHAAVGCPAGTVGLVVAPQASALATLVKEHFADTLLVSLAVRDQRVGTLELGRVTAPPFSAEDRTIVELVSSRFALLIERHRLQQAEADARALAAEALAALRIREERVEAMVDGAFAFIGLLSPDGRVLEVNQSAVRFAGVAKGDVLDRLFWDTPWWTHDEAQRTRLRAAIAAGAKGEPAAFEATHRSAEGRLAVVDFTLRPVRVGANPAAYLVAEGRDVTAHSRATAELTRSRDELAGQLSVQADELLKIQALHRAVVETIVDGVIMIDQRGRMEWTNEAALRMFGYEAGEVMGQNVRMLMASPDAEHHDSYLERYLRTGDRKVIGIGREVRGKRRDQSEFPLYLAVGETHVDGVRKFTGIVRDLSETKRLEQLLQERQTLARIGELASVVAHEVRNPLAAIRGVVEVIQTRFPADSPDRKILGDLLVRVDSLDQLVSDLLVYARPTSPVFRRAWMLALARDTAALVANDRGAGAVRFDVSGDDAELWIDPAQMGRALLNLMTNAAQAMRDSGVVRITGERLGDRYRLTVADDGPGMPPDVATRCLEPFFTTKTRGTGLGLPIAKRVVDEHGGGFAVSADPGAGTRVSIVLPLDDAPAVGE